MATLKELREAVTVEKYEITMKFIYVLFIINDEDTGLIFSINSFKEWLEEQGLLDIAYELRGVEYEEKISFEEWQERNGFVTICDNLKEYAITKGLINI